MAKSKKRFAPPPPVQVAPKIVWSLRAKRIMGVGLFMVFLGFLILGYADPSGQNWAATLAPFLLVSGYAFIGISLAFRRSSKTFSLPSK